MFARCIVNPHQATKLNQLARGHAHSSICTAQPDLLLGVGVQDSGVGEKLFKASPVVLSLITTLIHCTSFSFKPMITRAFLPFPFLATCALLYLLKMACAKWFSIIMLHFFLKMWWRACMAMRQYMGTVLGEVQAETWVWSSLWYYLRCTYYPLVLFHSLFFVFKL